MKQGWGVCLLAIGVAAAQPAWASDKRDFEQCDGLIHPGRQDDGMRRSASSSSFGGMLPLSATSDIAACTRALASPRLLPTQTLRRVNLLRARGAARLSRRQYTEALADLDEAERVAQPIAQDPFYRRSMGVSLTLLRAIAEAGQGHPERSIALTREAMAARPYAANIQFAGVRIIDAVQVAPPDGAPAASPWLALARLDPTARERAMLDAADAGDFANVIALRSRITLDWPEKPVPPLAILQMSGDGLRLFGGMMLVVRSAYANAATGNGAAARRELDEVRTQIARQRSGEGQTQGGDKGSKGADKDRATPAQTSFQNSIAGLLDTFVDQHSRLVEARIALAAGQPQEALAATLGKPLPKGPDTREFLTALRAALPDAGVPAPEAPEADQGAERRLQLAALIPSTLIAAESPRAVIDYERARPNILGALVGGALSLGTSLLGGISRTDGFRSADNPDGTIKVEFIGNTPSQPIVQEMTLLRAAELVRAAGKAKFVILDRSEYERRMTTTQNGVQISSVNSGYKSELTIRALDTDDTGDALDAVAIIDALGPLYYEDKPARS